MISEYLKKQEKEEKQEIKSFSEVVGRKYFNVQNKVKFSDLIDKEIIIKDFQILPSKFGKGEFAVVLASFPNREEFFTITSSQVIMKQLNEIKEKLPVKATVKKVKKYYTFR